MQARIDYAKTNPAAGKALLGLEKYVWSSGLEPPLSDLVRLRGSEINGCAFWLDMHSQDARAAGESEQRRYVHRLAIAFRAVPGTYQPAPRGQSIGAPRLR